MSINAQVADHIESATELNTEKRDTLIFFAFALALVAAIVTTALTVGLAGVGVIAVCEAAAMLLVCILLTAG